jgi:predicted dehydrogenase
MQTTRRRFLTRSATALAAPAFIPASALGLDDHTAPSNRITVGAIGIGQRMTRAVLPAFMNEADVQCVAVADCFEARRLTGKREVDKFYKNTDCVMMRFHEEILERDDIDAVLIATGDRWHAVLSVIAARAGKDVYCEKPYTMTIGEGRAAADTLAKLGTVCQIGTQRRSNPSFRYAINAVREGKIGRLHTVTTYLAKVRPTQLIHPAFEPEPDADVFDYDRWTGQAPVEPYSLTRIKQWRWRWDTGGGIICDMGPHYYDLAQWAHDSEDTGPVSFEGTATWPPEGGYIQTPLGYTVTARYADGAKIVTTTTDDNKKVKFEGDEGWLEIDDMGNITSSVTGVQDNIPQPALGYPYMQEHVRNFLDCMRTRKPTNSNPEIAQRNHTICHAVNACLRLDRKLEWDPKTERYVNDDEANATIDRPMREPWVI